MFIFRLLYAIFECFWRRWFGGKPIGGKDKDGKWFNKRWFRHLVGFMITYLVLEFYGYSFSQSILTTLTLQFMYWAKAHGEFFDFGHNNPPDISRYEKFWWWEYVKQIMPKNIWYTYPCDFICMFIRYTIPSVIISIILMSVAPLTMGLVVSCSYALMWCFYDWFGLKNPTEYGEYLAGFFTGLLLLA